jgi:hypothetical protein
MRRWIVRPLGWLLGDSVLLVLLTAGAIRLDQYRLRWRGERLQADIRALELRKATYADVRQLEDRWLDDTKERVCRPSWCDLDIFLGNGARRHIEFFVYPPQSLPFTAALEDVRLGRMLTSAFETACYGGKA